MTIDIIQGDCLVEIPTLTQKFRLVLCDPPYGKTFLSFDKSPTYDWSKWVYSIMGDLWKITPEGGQ